jgi:hypothetical protein
MCETGCRSTKRRTSTKRCTSRRRRKMSRARRLGASRGRLTTRMSRSNTWRSRSGRRGSTRRRSGRRGSTRRKRRTIGNGSRSERRHDDHGRALAIVEPLVPSKVHRGNDVVDETWQLVRRRREQSDRERCTQAAAGNNLVHPMLGKDGGDGIGPTNKCHQFVQGAVLERRPGLV